MRPKIRCNDAWSLIPLELADDYMAFFDHVLQATHPLRAYELFPIAKCWRKEKYLVEEKDPSDLLWVLDLEKKTRIKGKTCYYFKQLKTQEELDELFHIEFTDVPNVQRRGFLSWRFESLPWRISI